MRQYPVVHADQTVSDVYDELVQYEAVIVPVEGEQWSLSRQDIFSFLSKKIRQVSVDEYIFRNIE